MDSPYVPFTAINIVFFKKITKLDTKKHPYLQAGGRRFESDYLHKKRSSTCVGDFFLCRFLSLTPRASRCPRGGLMKGLRPLKHPGSAFGLQN